MQSGNKFVFNVGVGVFENSKLYDLLVKRDFVAAADGLFKCLSAVKAARKARRIAKEENLKPVEERFVPKVAKEDLSALGDPDGELLVKGGAETSAEAAGIEIVLSIGINATIPSFLGCFGTSSTPTLPVLMISSIFGKERILSLSDEKLINSFNPFLDRRMLPRPSFSTVFPCKFSL